MKENTSEEPYEMIENEDAEIIEDDLKPSLDETSLNQILISLISDKKNISLKTELHNPKALAVLSMLSDFFRRKKYLITAGVIDKFIETYMEYMVSNKRRSRKEIIQALTAWFERENTLQESIGSNQEQEI